MYSGLLNHCLRDATSALRQNKLACRTPLGLADGASQVIVVRNN